MLMTKGLDLKILYTLLIAVSGIVLTIGAASALMVYAENLEVNNPAGDSSIKVTSSTGDSKIILEDQGKRTWSVKSLDGTKKFQITDETKNKPRLTIKALGQVGIGTAGPTEKLDVNGNLRVRTDANVEGNLNVDGVITGDYIAALEATIAALEARIASLETGADPTVPIVSMVLNHGTMIDDNSLAIEVNAAAIESGGGGPNPCNPDGDGAITAQEVKDLFESHGISVTLSSAQNLIYNVESATGINNSGVLDDPVEVAWYNSEYVIPNGIPTCVFP